MVQNYVEQNGGQFIFETAGEHLILDESGNVKGVTGTKNDGTPIKVNADAVLLATGGYLGSKEMLAEHFGDIGIVPLGNTLSTGDGIRMAQEAGATLEKNSFTLISNEFAGENEKGSGWRNNDNSKYAIYGGLLVNSEGTRFMNEEIMATKTLAGFETIPGLYAAGVDAGSLFTTPYYGNEGAAFGMSISSGSVAGSEIAEFIKGLKGSLN